MSLFYSWPDSSSSSSEWLHVVLVVLLPFLVDKVVQFFGAISVVLFSLGNVWIG